MLPHKSKSFNYLPVKDHLIIAQKIDDPEDVFFYWKPNTIITNFMLAIRDVFLKEFPGINYDAPSITVKTRYSVQIWDGIRWDTHSDNIIKSLAEAFIDLRFASPERTQIMIQDDLWPEISDEQ